MRNKSLFLFFLLPVLLSAAVQEKVVPFNQEEFTQFVKRMEAGYFNPEVPHLPAQTAINLLDNLFKQFVQTEIPATLDRWRELRAKGEKLPTRSTLLMYSKKLRTLMNDPELPEVTEISMAWYASVGKMLASLDGAYDAMMHAAQTENKVLYQKNAAAYRAAVQKLEAVMQKPQKLTHAQLNLIIKQNTEMRRKKYNKLILRYNKTLELQEKAEKALKAKPKSKSKK